jgi:hypothetical protein
MSEVWRFTGPPENWLTAFGLSKWALNENNKLLWERQIRPGDVVFFHSTKQSAFTDRAISSIVGLGYVGDGISIKKDLWWIQELNDQTNHWPYVVPLKEIYLFSDVKEIDFSTPVHKKSAAQVKSDIDRLIAQSLPIGDLNERAVRRDPNSPDRPDLLYQVEC